MTTLLIAAAMLVTLVTTVVLLFTHSARQVDRLFSNLRGLGAMIVTGIMLLVIIAFNVAMKKQGEFTASPFRAFEVGNREGGVFEGMYFFAQTFVFLAWAFFLPAHLYANGKSDREESRPLYPYAINFLIGIILCAENTPLHDFLGRLMRH